MRPRFAMISANGGHQERRARANANGEELERYQSLDWRAQGWTMNDDELRKNGENMAQPTSLYVNSSPPAKRPSRGPWHVRQSASRLQQSRCCKSCRSQHSRTQCARVCRDGKDGMPQGGLPGLQWAGAVSSQGFSRAFSGRIERLQAFHSVARLFTALIQVLAGPVIPSARSSMAGALRGPEDLRAWRGARGHDYWTHDAGLAVAPGRLRSPHAVSTLVQWNCGT
jgi:hypothetical protein